MYKRILLGLSVGLLLATCSFLLMSYLRIFFLPTSVKVIRSVCDVVIVCATWGQKRPALNFQ